MERSKIYLVVTEDIEVDTGIDEKGHFAFSTREKAIVKFNSVKKDFEHYWKEESSKEYLEEVDEDYYCICDKGCYCFDHSLVYITVINIDEECDTNA